MTVYVTGSLGEVAQTVHHSLEAAFREVCRSYVPLDVEQVEWTLQFVDSNVGDPEALVRWLATVVEKDLTTTVYIEPCELADA